MGMKVPVPVERHLLRAKDTIDARYRESLDVPKLARAAHLSPAHFSREFRRAFARRRTSTPDPAARASGGAAAQHRPLRSGGLPRRRADQRRLLHDELRPRLRPHANGLPRAHPPASIHVRIPTCVLQVYGRPRSSRFREDTVRRRIASSGQIRTIEEDHDVPTDAHAGLVHDQDEALAFYTDKLGMELREDVTVPGWATSAGSASGSRTGRVHHADGDPGPPVFEEETRQQINALLAKGASGGSSSAPTTSRRATRS